MTRPIPVPIAEKNAGILLEESMAACQGAVETKSLRGILYVCRLRRRIGVAKLLTGGDPQELFVELSRSAWAFAHWLGAHGDGDKRTSWSAPFFDALVAGNREAASAIAIRSRSSHHAGVEYEEDFAYPRILQLLHLERVGEAEALLAFWKGLSGGTEGRFALCAALLARDQVALTAAVEDFLPEALKPDPDEISDGEAAVTTGRVCLEAAGVARLATQMGLSCAIRHARVPAELLMAPRGVLPGPESWKTVEGYRSL